MLNLFEFTSYRSYLERWIDSQGSRSYGLKGKMALSLKISSSLVSQILSGEKSLTSDQTSDLSDFLGLSEIESDYFHLLVEKDRSGNPRYREKLEKKIKNLQQQSQKIGKRVPRNIELSDEQKAIYYSSWLYTGIRNLTAIKNFKGAEQIANHLGLEVFVVQKIVRFLLENGLCKEEKGELTYGPASTHVDKDSPFVNKHHQNWRIQSIQTMDQKSEDDIFFTSPMSLSVEAAAEIKKMLPQLIQDVMKISGPSESEKTYCLNIDWFKF